MRIVRHIQKPGVRKWLRRLRRTAWALALLAFVRFAYTRWTTPPAAMTRGTAARPASGAADLEPLYELLARLPVFTRSRPTSQPSWWCQDPLADATCGAWTPSDRPLIADAIAYVTDERVTAVLDQVRDHCARAANSQPAAGAESAAIGSSARDRLPDVPRAFQNLATTLAARARCRAMEQHDLAGALDDLRTALRLARAYDQYEAGHQNPVWAWRERPDRLPLAECEHFAQEQAVPPPLAAEMITFLQADPSASPAELMVEAAGLPGDIEAFLDQYYTDDGRGNGWLVLSHAGRALSPFSLALSASTAADAPRAGFWNLFSPLFNDRRTVRGRLERWRAAAHAIRTDSPTEGLRRLHAEVGWTPPFAEYAGCLDGPLMSIAQGLTSARYTEECWRAGRRRALVVMLALSAFRHDHHAYPASLDMLAPTYLEAIPGDALTGQPFAYAQTAPDAYELKPPDAARTCCPQAVNAYSERRPEPRCE